MTPVTSVDFWRPPVRVFSDPSVSYAAGFVRECGPDGPLCKRRNLIRVWLQSEQIRRSAGGLEVQRSTCQRVLDRTGPVWSIL